MPAWTSIFLGGMWREMLIRDVRSSSEIRSAVGEREEANACGAKGIKWIGGGK